LGKVISVWKAEEAGFYSLGQSVDFGIVFDEAPGHSGLVAFVFSCLQMYELGIGSGLGYLSIFRESLTHLI
jgi:hypothetical protein